MKKVSVLSFFAALLLLNTGCLKDKDFEDQKYGIQGVDSKGVAFPQAASSPLSIGLDRQTAPQSIDGPLLTLEQTGTASSDVTVTLVVDTTLAIAEGLTPLPASAYTISTLTPVIAAGQTTFGNLSISVLNVFDDLDPTVAYGIGLRIASATGGYQVAANQSTVVLQLLVKNPYAADYTVTGFFFHPTAAREIDDEKPLTTVSATVVKAPHSDLYTSNYYFTFSVDDVTKQLINYAVPSTAATPQPPASGFMTMDVPFVGTFAPLAPGTAPWVHSTYNNTYDEATQTFWMHYGYATGASSQVSYTRQVYEKWVRIP